MSAAAQTTADPRPAISLPSSPSSASSKPTAIFASKSQKNRQSDAKLAPVVETQIDPSTGSPSPQPPVAPPVLSESTPAVVETPTPHATGFLQHPGSADAETGEERALIAEGFALLVSQVRKSNRGRPTVIDEPMKARIATLMGVGLSMRQAAACLGINQATISRAVAADKELKHDIECARTRATLHPLACVLRESGKNWKAAVWLLEHLSKTAFHEKTPLERAEDTAVRRIEDDLARELKPRLMAEARAELALQPGQAAPPRRRDR